jgi:hypothetical protein
MEGDTEIKLKAPHAGGKQDGNVKSHSFQINNWNHGNRNGVSIKQMFTREGGQLKTQNQALEETVAL